jgi:hypothetical protein
VPLILIEFRIRSVCRGSFHCSAFEARPHSTFQLLLVSFLRSLTLPLFYKSVFCFVFVNSLWLLACCLSRFTKIMAQQEDNRKIENTTENTIVMDQQINVARSELKNLRYDIIKMKAKNVLYCIVNAFVVQFYSFLGRVCSNMQIKLK